ncbi:cytochrome P450 [Streptomyces radicis]|uniref:cytochrome P450 n=1 Tax=Streptomyces radicis TaxID=1750517 RepID=UPI0016047EB1|nr:cytochrome P450 [Streptomyces radicis]
MCSTSSEPARRPETRPPEAERPTCPVARPGPGGVQRLDGRAVAAEPAALFERLRAEHGPVVPVLLEGDEPAWLVVGYHEVLHVARNPRRFSRDGRLWTAWREGRVGPQAPLAPVLAWGPDCAHQDGAEHQRLRAAVNESLGRFDRRGLRRLVRRHADRLIDDFAGEGHAELLSRYARRLPMLTLTEVLGLPPDEGPGLVEAGRRLLLGAEDAVANDRHIHRVLRATVERKHAAPGHDLASWLIAHPADLTDDEVVHQLRLVLVAANESTTNLVVNTLRVVLAHPPLRGSLFGGRITLAAAVEQVLWDEPPISVCPGGFATQDLELGGQRVHAGDVLLLGLAAANADPRIRPSPRASTHGNRSHLAFAGGPHECPGQDIGRAVAVTAIDALLGRLPDVRLAVEPEELTWSASTWARHLDALPVAFTARRPAPRAPAPAPPVPPAPRAAPPARPPRELHRRAARAGRAAFARLLGR